MLASDFVQAETAPDLNRDVDKITTWATNWKVTVNASKFKDFLFSNKWH